MNQLHEKPKYALLYKPNNDDDIQKMLRLIQIEADRSNCWTLNKTKKFSNDLKQTPYHIQSHHKIIEALVAARFPTYTSRDIYNKTCLHYPKDYRSLLLLVPLLDCYRKLNKLDINGDSILHQRHDVESMQFLLNNNANPLILNNNGQCCIDFQISEDCKNYIKNFINNYLNQSYNDFCQAIEKHKRSDYELILKLRNKNYNGNDIRNKRILSLKIKDIDSQEKFNQYLRLYKIKYLIYKDTDDDKSSKIVFESI